MMEFRNWRWNSRKAIDRGATLSSLAALIVAQFTPVSGAEKMARPKVSRRVSTEFVTTSGQRKSLQWWLTEIRSYFASLSIERNKSRPLSHLLPA